LSFLIGEGFSAGNTKVFEGLFESGGEAFVEGTEVSLSLGIEGETAISLFELDSERIESETTSKTIIAINGDSTFTFARLL
jgi:hypothetical protein